MRVRSAKGTSSGRTTGAALNSCSNSPRTFNNKLLDSRSDLLNMGSRRVSLEPYVSQTSMLSFKVWAAPRADNLFGFAHKCEGCSSGWDFRIVSTYWAVFQTGLMWPLMVMNPVLGPSHPKSFSSLGHMLQETFETGRGVVIHVAL